MPMPAGQKSFTYREYLEWDTEMRVELIDGAVYDMTPAPSRAHQRISMALSGGIWSHLGSTSSCEVYVAPFDVRLPEGDEPDDLIRTVVQPDISVICDRSKLDDKGCRGAPDWIIEIISPATASGDYIRKLTLYEKHGVREYWIVHPVDRIVMVYCMDEEGRYGRPDIYSIEDSVEPRVIEGLVIELGRVFEP